MNIQISPQGNNPICKLAFKIVSDWVQKLEIECKSDPNSCLDLKFKAMITESKLFSTINQKSLIDFNLIIVVQDIQLGPSHILALSEQLSTFGQNSTPFIPVYVAQIVIANCISIFILQTIFTKLALSQTQANVSRKLDTNPIQKLHKISCIDCLKYLGAFNISSKANGMMAGQRGSNILDGGAPFYCIYPTKQGLLAIGNLQPKFYQQMVQELGLLQQDKRFCLENQLNFDAWPKLRKIFSEKLTQKSAEQWQSKMGTRDTCVTVVRHPDKNINKNFLHPFLIQPKL